MLKKNKINRDALIWLNKITGSGKLYIGLLMVVQIILGMIGVGYALILRELLDEAVEGNKVLFFRWIAIFILVIVVQLFLGATRRFLNEYTSSVLENRLKERLLKYLFNCNYEDVVAVHSGEWMNRLTSDTVIVADTLTQIIPGICGMLIRMVGALIFFLMLYPKGFIIFVLGGGALLIVTYIFRKKLKILHKQVQEADGELRIYLQECLASMLVVRIFAQEKQVVEKAIDKMYKHKIMRMKKNNLSNLSNIGFASVMNGAYVLIAGICGYGILNGTISYGTLMAMIQLLGQIQSPFANITGYIPRYYAMIASTERLMEIEKYQTSIRENEKSVEEIKQFYQTRFQSIIFEQVDFAYRKRNSNDGEIKVLENLNLSIHKSSCVAITGPSGCGKSTILKLMMAIYPIMQGSRIIKTSKDYIPLTMKWRGLFAYVPQGNQLMSGSIREIITFGDKQQMMEEEKLNLALTIADAKEFVDQLPEGVDTILGEKGTGLSEGQMQRIAIARAVFADRPILMLDESTSALDEQTEKRILQNLQNMTDKTIVIVTHRKAVLEICDVEIKFSEGQVREVI